MFTAPLEKSQSQGHPRSWDRSHSIEPLTVSSGRWSNQAAYVTSFSGEGADGRQSRAREGSIVQPDARLENTCFVAVNFLERSPGWDFPCLARSANYLCGESWEALGPRRPGQLSIVTKIALLGEGRYFLWLRFPLGPPGPQKERGESQQRAGLGRGR